MVIILEMSAVNAGLMLMMCTYLDYMCIRLVLLTYTCCCFVYSTIIPGHSGAVNHPLRPETREHTAV